MHDYQLVKNYVDHGGRIAALALRLNCSERTARRKINGYKQYGKAFFLHGNRDRTPVTTTPPEVVERIITLYLTTYEGANFTHFHELLERYHADDIPAIMTTLERLQIEGEAKWKILSLLNDPIGKFQSYLDLLEKIKQPFGRYYTEVARQVADYQAAFEHQLSQGRNPLHLIMDLTFRKVDQLTDKPIVVYPLGLNRYLLSVHELPESRFISLGIGLEEYQTRIKQSQTYSREARINALRSMGDKMRYELMRLLAERLSNKELAERLNVTSPNISYHIKTLLNENLIVLEILDNKSYPVVNKTVLKELLADIALDFELNDE